jgi:hypothetical protein
LLSPGKRVFIALPVPSERETGQYQKHHAGSNRNVRPVVRAAPGTLLV